jgi:RNA polymerase sigma-70 factor (ECF subfamily)
MMSEHEESARERSVRRAELMRRAQDGDAEAYRLVLHDIGPLIGRWLRRWVADPHDVDDLMQEALMTVHRARHTYDPARPLEPWLFAITRNIAKDHLRQRGIRLARERPVESMPTIAAAADEGDPVQRLEDILAQLPARQREAFELLKLEGLSLEEAATRAGTTVGALKVRAHRAYRAIKALLRS